MKAAIVVGAVLAALALQVTPATASGAATSGDGAYILSVGALKVGDAVPRFKAKDIFGVTLNFDEIMRSGKRPVIAFWSMYCQACIEKFNAMVAIQSKFDPQGVMVISVNTDGEYQRGEQEIRDFLLAYERKHNVRINFPVLYDERNWVPTAMHIEFLPTIVSVDPQGRVCGFYQGFNEAGQEEILAGIENLINRMLEVYAAVPTAATPASPGKK